jgi:hypothetical protein
MKNINDLTQEVNIKIEKKESLLKLKLLRYNSSLDELLNKLRIGFYFKRIFFNIYNFVKLQFKG